MTCAVQSRCGWGRPLGILPSAVLLPPGGCVHHLSGMPIRPNHVPFKTFHGPCEHSPRLPGLCGLALPPLKPGPAGQPPFRLLSWCSYSTSATGLCMAISSMENLLSLHHHPATPLWVPDQLPLLAEDSQERHLWTPAGRGPLPPSPFWKLVRASFPSIFPPSWGGGGHTLSLARGAPPESVHARCAQGSWGPLFTQKSQLCPWPSCSREAGGWRRPEDNGQSEFAGTRGVNKALQAPGGPGLGALPPPLAHSTA